MTAFARILTVAAFLGVGIVSCFGGDDALYGHQPSKDAVLLRFVNATDAPMSIETNLLPAVTLGETAVDRIGAFAVVDRETAPSLEITAKVEGIQGHDTIALKAGTKVSIVVRREGEELRFKAFATTPDMSTGRTVLSFINAAPSCGATSLKLEPAGATIFADVPADTESSRKINPVSARISASCGASGTAVATLERSEPGGVVSVWLLALAGRPTLVVHADAVPSWHP